MMVSLPATPRTPGRGRSVLVALCVLFFGSMLAASGLRLLGWQPAISRNHGQLLSPPVDLRALTLRQLEGEVYHWQPSQRRWRIALAPPIGCVSACQTLAADLDKVWRLLGVQASRVELLWIGATPPTLPAMPMLRRLREDPELRRRLPGLNTAGRPSVYLIDPHGFVILRYPPGFDPAGLRADLAKLLKLM